MREHIYILKGAKHVLVPKEGVSHALKALKKFGIMCLSTGALYAASELLKGANRGLFKDVTEETNSVCNLIRNSFEKERD